MNKIFINFDKRPMETTKKNYTQVQHTLNSTVQNAGTLYTTEQSSCYVIKKLLSTHYFTLDL